MKALVCTSCPAGQNFDAQSKVCVPGAQPNVTQPTKPNATNFDAADNYLGPQPTSSPNDIPCPE